jgi:hypothetical protein
MRGDAKLQVNMALATGAVGTPVSNLSGKRPIR